MTITTAIIETFELDHNYFCTMVVNGERKYMHIMFDGYVFRVTDTDEFGWAASSPYYVSNISKHIRKITNR
jgi:hypothetical protein